MCLQCIVDAKMICEDFIPGYGLYVSRRHDEEWPLGWYGLVVVNNPDFVFPPDLDDKDFDEHFYADPLRGYKLYEACLKAGYDREDTPVHRWIANRIKESLGLAD